MDSRAISRMDMEFYIGTLLGGPNEVLIYQPCPFARPVALAVVHTGGSIRTIYGL